MQAGLQLFFQWNQGLRSGFASARAPKHVL